MTANVMDQDKQAAIEAGMDDHIGKPIDLEAMVNTIIRNVHNNTQGRHSFSSEQPPNAQNASSIAAVISDEELNAPERINAELAMERLGNNKLMYLKTVNLFLRDAPNMLADIPATWPVDPRAGTIAAHTLKSIAGTVGAIRVEEICKTVEQVLRQHEQSEGYDNEVALLREEFALAIESLKNVVAEYEGEKEGASPDRDFDLLAHMKSLKTHLLDSNMEACEIFDDIKRNLDSAAITKYETLETLINSLDFDSAADECDVILNSMID